MPLVIREASIVDPWVPDAFAEAFPTASCRGSVCCAQQQLNGSVFGANHCKQELYLGSRCVVEGVNRCKSVLGRGVGMYK